MTQPITYYAQNDAIERLIEKYGQALELMTRLEKLFLLSLITNALSASALQTIDADSVIRTAFIQECLEVTRNSSEHDLTGLSMAIAAQLHDGIYYQPPKPSDRDDSIPF